MSFLRFTVAIVLCSLRGLANCVGLAGGSRSNNVDKSDDFFDRDSDNNFLDSVKEIIDKVQVVEIETASSNLKVKKKTVKK